MNKFIFSVFIFVHTFLYADTPVLIIHSYHESYPWSSNQDRGFKEVLDGDEKLFPLYSTEYIDSKRRGFDKAYEEEFVHYMRSKYKGYQPQLIYTTDDDAFNFMLRNKDKLFPSVPLVFSGLNDLSQIGTLRDKRIAGVFEKKDVASNIRLIRSLFPNEKEIVLLGDKLTTSQVVEKVLLDEFATYGLNIRSIHDEYLTNVLEELKAINSKVVVLNTIGGVKTIDGHLIPLKQVIKELNGIGDMIVISLEDTYVQYGVLGGYVNNSTHQGEEAGRIALKILHDPLSTFPKNVASRHGFLFDAQALEEHGIILPDEIMHASQLVNQPVSLAHRSEYLLKTIIYALIALLVLASLGFARYMYRSRNIILKNSETLAVTTESMERAQSIAHLGNWDWDIQNNTLWWSDEIYRIFGLEPKEFEATYEAFLKHVHPEDKERVNKVVNEALEKKTDYHVFHRIIKKDGTERYVSEEGSLKFDDQGTPIRMTGIVHDITEEYEQEQSIILQAEIFNAVQDSIMVHDLQGHFVYLNENAWKSRGYTEDEMLDMTVEELDAPEYKNASPEEMEKFLARLKEEGYVTFKVEHLCKDGRRLPVEIYSKLITLNDKPYVLSSVRDITQQKRADDAIKASEKKYRDFVENSIVGIYRANIEGKILYANPALARMWGCASVDEVIGEHELRLFESSQESEMFIHDLQKTGRLINYELTAHDKNNKAFPILISAILEGDTLTGMVLDMSEIKRSQTEIEKLSKVVEQIDDTVVITDHTGTITYANHAFYNDTGYTREEVLGKKPSILKSGRHDAEFYKDLWKTIKQGDVYRGTLINKKKSGELFYEKKTITPLKDNMNNIIGYVSSGKDTTMETMMHQEIEHIASTDKLTGIHNRYKFEELFILELERSRRFGYPMSLILIDIDYFKTVNDTYGHDVGDKVLKSLADIIQMQIRKLDVFARWGGEEFLVLAPNTDLANASILAEKMRLAIDAFSFPSVGDVTISIGVSQLAEGDHFDELFKKADQALYRAKEKGRNQVSTSVEP